jgi:hypothetical protein
LLGEGLDSAHLRPIFDSVLDRGELTMSHVSLRFH